MLSSLSIFVEVESAAGAAAVVALSSGSNRSIR